MNSEKPVSLEDALDTLQRLDQSSIRDDGVTNQFLEVRRALVGNEVTISGNQEGLIHLARLVLEVAKKGFDGAHQHLDDAGALDVCDLPIVIGFKSAEWDV